MYSADGRIALGTRWCPLPVRKILIMFHISSLRGGCAVGVACGVRAFMCVRVECEDGNSLQADTLTLTHTQADTLTLTHTQADTLHRQTHTHTYTGRHTHTRTYTGTHSHSHIHRQTHSHTYTGRHTHTRTYTGRHTHISLSLARSHSLPPPLTCLEALIKGVGVQRTDY